MVSIIGTTLGVTAIFLVVVTSERASQRLAARQDFCERISKDEALYRGILAPETRISNANFHKLFEDALVATENQGRKLGCQELPHARR